MSKARHELDWEGQFACALDPVKARKYYESAPPEEANTCSMCGKMCAVRTVNKVMGGKVIDLDYC
jgi:phosphomethylpyrimidine synthase